MLTSLVGVVAAVSAVAKVSRHPQVMDTLDRVRTPPGLRPALPLLECAGAAGAFAGLAAAWLGVAALGGLAAYFVGAVIFHLRVRDSAAHTAPPAVLAVLAAAAAITRALSA
ncbi:MAG: DoxX family protein [Actinomycetota bacterium]